MESSKAYDDARMDFVSHGRQHYNTFKVAAHVPPKTFTRTYDVLYGAHQRTTTVNMKKKISITIRRDISRCDHVDFVVLQDGVESTKSVFLPTITINFEVKHGMDCVEVFRTDSGGTHKSRFPCVRILRDGSAKFSTQGVEIIEFLSLWNADAVKCASQLGKFTGHCLDCGHAITTTTSLERGIGPKCFETFWGGRNAGYNLDEQGILATHVDLSPIEAHMLMVPYTSRGYSIDLVEITVIGAVRPFFVSKKFVRSISYNVDDGPIAVPFATEERIKILDYLVVHHAPYYGPELDLPNMLILCDHLGVSEYHKDKLRKKLIAVMTMNTIEYAADVVGM
jgi:hypothetical protein